MKLKKINNEIVLIPFGKYKGEQVADCPRDYLNWLLEQDWLYDKYPDLLDAIEEECHLRDRSYDTY